MIKTIEIAPHIYAQELSEHIWNTFSTGEVYSKRHYEWYESPAIILKKEDLQEVIKAFILKDE